MDSKEERGRVREAFRNLFQADLAAGRAGDLPRYKMLFPGYWDVVAEEFEALAPSVPPAEPTVASGARGPVPQAPPEDRIGPYQTLRELGRGGMGVVYLAEDTRLHRRVALKVLTPQFAASRHLLLRFRREAEVASRIDHPGICAVYDADVDGEVPYIAMRYVEGKTLQQWIADSRDPSGGSGEIHATFLPGGPQAAAPASAAAAAAVTTGSLARREEVLRVVQMVEKAARALHVAHETGLIHRDIKPGNIMVTDAGEPVVLDFGLARADDEESANLTQTGSLMGTPAYMSPEQLMAQRIKLDRRTDVYSLGATLYECVTLRRPFEAPTLDGLYQKILATDPDNPRRLNAAVPEDLRVVLETALEKDRARRYQTALDFAEDLRRVRELEPIRARPIGPLVRLGRWCQRNPALAASVFGLFVVMAAGLGTSLHLLAQANADRLRAEASERKTADALKDVENERTKATDALKKVESERALKEKANLDLAETLKKVLAERDAKTLALAEAEGRRLPIQAEAIRDAHPTLALLLALEAVQRYPTLQGRNAVVGSLEALREVRTLVVPRRLVRNELQHFSQVIPCPDGRTAVGIFGDGEPFVADLAAGTVQPIPEGSFYRVALDGNGSRALLLGGGSALVLDVAGRRVICRIADSGGYTGGFSADGREVVTAGVLTENGRAFYAIVRFDAATGRNLGRVALAQGGYWGRLTPDGSRFVMPVNGVGTVLIDAATGSISVPVPHPPGRWDRWISADGNLALATDADLQLQGIRDTRTMRVTAVRGGTVQVEDVAFSQDGGRVAVAVLPKGRVLVIGTSDGAVVRTIETGETSIAGLRLDREGGRLAVIAGAEGTVWSVGTGALLARLRGHVNTMRGLTFVDDGRTVLTTGMDGTIRTWDVAREFPFPLLELDPDRPGGAEAAPAAVEFGRDGTTLLTHCRGRAVIRDAAEGTQRHRLERAGTTVVHADLSASGARAATVHADGTASTWETATGRETPVVPPGGIPINRALFTPDGASLVLVTRDRVPLVLDLASGAFRKHGPVADSAPATSLVAVDVDPSGERMLEVEESGVIRIRDLATGREITNLGRLPGTLRGAVFAADGKHVYRMGTNIARWDIETGDLESVATVPGVTISPGAIFAGSGSPLPAAIRLDPRTIASCVTDSDSTLAVTVGRDGAARVFALPSGEEILTCSRAGAAVAATIAPGGKTVLVQYGDGVGVLWPVDPVAAAAARLPRGISPDELDRYSVGTAEERAAARSRWREREFDALNEDDPFVAAAVVRVVKARTEHFLAEWVREALEADAALLPEERAAALRLARSLVDDLYSVAADCAAAGAKPDGPPERVARSLRVVRHCLETHPGDFRMQRTAALLLLRSGDLAGARAAMNVARARPADAPLRVDLLLDLADVILLAREGAVAEARATCGRVIAGNRDRRYADSQQDLLSISDIQGLLFEGLKGAFGPRGVEALSLIERTGDRDFVVEDLIEKIRALKDVPEEDRATAAAIVESAGDSGVGLQAAARRVVLEKDRPAAEYAKALRWAERGAAMAPGKEAKALVGMARVRLGQFDAALVDFAEVPDPTRETGGFIALAHHGRGDDDLARKSLEKSHAALSNFGLCGCEAEELLIDPAELALRRDLAKRAANGLKAVLMESLRADPATAPDLLRKAENLVRRFPDTSTALNNAAWAIVRQDGASPEAVQRALRWTREACDRSPGDANCMNTRGVAEYRAGEFETALTTLRASGALQRVSARPEGEAFDLAFQAMCLARLGRREEAQAALAGARECGTKGALSDLPPVLGEAEGVVGGMSQK